MKLFVAGLSFKSAPVAVREKLAVAAKAAACRGCRVKVGAGLEEVVVLSTCNRVEIYGAAGKVNGNVHGIFRHWGVTEVDVAPFLYVKEDGAAAEHLFSVASGLDSMVIGETEITGQVKTAYQTAKDARLTGRMTNRWFQTALQVAKEIRTSTGIGRGAVSVGSVSVELMEKIYENGLKDKTVMIIGAGKMGEACVNHLVKKGASSVLVVNRSLDKAETLAAQVNGKAVRFDDLLSSLRDADIVISSTGAGRPILGRVAVEQVMALRPNRPLSIVDIAVPRDVAADVQEIPGVYLYNIDDLQEVMRENLKLRETELSKCQKTIAGRAALLMDKLNSRPAVAPPASWTFETCPA